MGGWYHQVPTAVMASVSGYHLTAEEHHIIRQIQPAGIILFRRNIQEADQVRKLVGDIAETFGTHSPFILIDQEGGRVRRLSAPPWPAFLSADRMAQHPAGLEWASRTQYHLTGAILRALGINVNCAPVMDVRAPDSHDGVMGDRCFGVDADTVITGGISCFAGQSAAGIISVMKHLPGHGRARVDSHYDMPVIDTPIKILEEQDFRPFKALSALNDPRLWGMTGHVMLPEIDPENPATSSKNIIDHVIRGTIGFDGILLSDDLEMGALKGDIGSRVRQSINAGCDVGLFCSGKLAVLAAVKDDLPRMNPQRWQMMLSSLETANAHAGDELLHHEQEVLLLKLLSDNQVAHGIVDPTLFIAQNT